jgi:hypothetical protein
MPGRFVRNPSAKRYRDVKTPSGITPYDRIFCEMNLPALVSRIARSEAGVGILRGLVIGVLIVAGFRLLHFPSALLSTSAPASIAVQERGAERASAGFDRLSPDARELVRWISASGDAAGAAFVIVDKKEAMVHVFDAAARWRGSSRVLLGGAIGDDTVSGIGERAIADVLPEERTTPAGRFVGERGHNARGEDVVWVDYDAGVSMHRVITSNPAERRLERLATPNSADKRISYGCINVPVQFYESHIGPTFADRHALVYILPETRTVAEVFGLGRSVAHNSKIE